MLKFYKYHGAGNDFIMIDNRDGHFDVKDTEKIKLLCDRHFGIGADGLILMEKSEKADCFMNYYNSDGTLAEMCGNGVRCLAKFFLKQTNSDAKKLSIDTRAEIKKIICNADESFSVNMGAPAFAHTDFPSQSLTFENISFNFVSMGNPHAVGFVKNLSEIDISHIGPKIENDPHFPNKINVEFVEKISNNHFKVRVWERGCGETMACGTGACAVYTIIKKENKDLNEMTLEFPGGNLFLSQNNKGEIILRGSAVYVFEGNINL